MTKVFVQQPWLRRVCLKVYVPFIGGHIKKWQILQIFYRYLANFVSRRPLNLLKCASSSTNEKNIKLKKSFLSRNGLDSADETVYVYIYLAHWE